jgi:hypothetical protein
MKGYILTAKNMQEFYQRLFWVQLLIEFDFKIIQSFENLVFGCILLPLERSMKWKVCQHMLLLIGILGSLRRLTDFLWAKERKKERKKEEKKSQKPVSFRCKQN